MAEEETQVQEQEVEQTTEEVKEEIIKPDYINEKFWNKNKNEVNIEDLALSYNSLEKKLGSRTDDLSKQIRQDIEQERLGSVPKEYEVKTPDIPEGINIEVNKEMPLLQWWEETARNNGLSQEQFDAGIKAFVDNEVSALPNIENEQKLLGENAKARIEAAELWAKKNLSDDAYNTVANIASTSNGVKMIEELMNLNKDTPMPKTETAIDAAPSLVDLRAMMRDPRYWDSGQRDDSYVKKVTDLYEKYYGKAEAPKS